MSKPKPQGPSITTRRIKDLMEEQQVTQVMLAEKMEVAPITIHRWVKGESNINSDKLKRMAEVLHTTQDYLLGVRGAFKNRSDQERADAEYYALFGDEIYSTGDEIYSTGDDPSFEEIKQRRTIRSRFFLYDLGYSYSDFSDGEAMFGGRFCTLKDQQGEEYDFTFEEFQQLLSQIKEKVDYACFKKRNTVRDCGGMKPIDPLERR